MNPLNRKNKFRNSWTRHSYFDFAPVTKAFWMAALAVLLVLLLWVKQSLKSTELSYQIQTVQKEIEKEQNKKNELQEKLNKNLSLDTVEFNAKQMGWIVPKSSAVVVVPL